MSSHLRTRSRLSRCSLVATFLLVSASLSSQGVEQTSFSAEESSVRRPVRLPNAVLELLRSHESVSECLAQREVSDEQLRSWFAASTIKLNDDSYRDYVVVPTRRENCLTGANIMPFWVIAGSKDGPKLVLQVNVHDLRILRTSHGELRDIHLISLTASDVSESYLHFKDGKYQLAQSSVKPIP
jgi:hypothetical protein